MSTGPWAVPYDKWDATISSSSVSSTGNPRAELSPSGSTVIKLLWDTFTLSSGLDVLRAKVTFRIVDAQAPDGACIVVGWDRSRPFSASDWGAPAGDDALAAFGLAALVSQVGEVYTLELDNASGLTRCTTGVVISLEPVGALTGVNALEIEGFGTGMAPELSLGLRRRDERDEWSGGGGWGGDGGWEGENPDGTDDEDNHEGPTHTAAKLNRELALRSERLAAVRNRPDIEYSTRLRAAGSVRVLQ